MEQRNFPEKLGHPRKARGRLLHFLSNTNLGKNQARSERSKDINGNYYSDFFFQCYTYFLSFAWVAILFLLLSATQSLWLSLSLHILFFSLMILYFLSNLCASLLMPLTKSTLNIKLYSFIPPLLLSLVQSSDFFHLVCPSWSLRDIVRWSKALLRKTFGSSSSGISVLY